MSKKIWTHKDKKGKEYKGQHVFALTKDGVKIRSFVLVMSGGSLSSTKSYESWQAAVKDGWENK